ncbi:MAG TPA: DUF4365 domain-containing protein [Polyangiaceae bacterium]|nr:DUF4365 domain-containing protein [Polyangiaceae bacterium]
MTTKKNRAVGRRRRTPQQEQERTSRHQLALAWKSWPLQANVEDLGEDLLFQLYEDGKYTSLSFYVQLKSASDLARFIKKRTPDSVTYRLPTKDLLHWTDSTPTVIIVVWDVQKAEGVWIDVPTAIKQLDARTPGWRSKGETVQVLLPRTQGTDVAGRAKLRRRLAQLAFPTLAHGRKIRVTPSFSFPKTPSGRAAHEALTRAIDEGGTATIEKEHITAFRIPGWWQRASGSIEPDSITITSRARPLTFPLRLQCVCPTSSASVDILLRTTRAGLKRITLESTPGAGPMNMTLILHTHEKRVETTLDFGFPCKKVDDSLALARLLITHKRGAPIRLVLPGGTPLGEVQLDPDAGRPLAELLRWEKTLQQLSFIQDRVSRYGAFDVRNLADADIPTIVRVHKLLQTGTYRTDMTFSMDMVRRPKLPPPGPDDGKHPLTLKINPFGEEKLLGVRIPFGEVTLEFINPVELLKQMRAARPSKRKPTTISVSGTPVLQRFHDWEPPKSGPEVEPCRPATESAAKQPRRRRAVNRAA